MSVLISQQTWTINYVQLVHMILQMSHYTNESADFKHHLHSTINQS